jgi:hypothetical protein
MEDARSLVNDIVHGTQEEEISEVKARFKSEAQDPAAHARRQVGGHGDLAGDRG